MPGKHAEMLSPTQEHAMLGSLDTTRYPSRDRVLSLSDPCGVTGGRGGVCLTITS